MKSEAITVIEYIESLAEERRDAIKLLRKTIKTNLPKGFKEVIEFGMIAYVVPHSLYPRGYHVNPKLALPFLCIASQKNFIAMYHMGIYGSPKLLEWFVGEYEKAEVGKLDMGKSCVRFKKLDKIPFRLIGELAGKITPEDWIQICEKHLKGRKTEINKR